jgi:hypothetical protein
MSMASEIKFGIVDELNDDSDRRAGKGGLQVLKR